MKIMERDGFGRVVDVYAIYWIDGIRYHLVIPYEGYHGLMIVTAAESDLIDPSIDGFVLRKTSSGNDMLVYWAAEQGDLLDRLIDPPDSEAVAELKRRISEGRKA